jgi:hypothetical protein
MITRTAWPDHQRTTSHRCAERGLCTRPSEPPRARRIHVEADTTAQLVRRQRTSRVDRLLHRALVTARRAREWSSEESERGAGGPPSGQARSAVARGARRWLQHNDCRGRGPGGDCEAVNARGNSAYASGSEEEPTSVAAARGTRPCGRTRSMAYRLLARRFVGHGKHPRDPFAQADRSTNSTMAWTTTSPAAFAPGISGW